MAKTTISLLLFALLLAGITSGQNRVFHSNNQTATAAADPNLNNYSGLQLWLKPSGATCSGACVEGSNVTGWTDSATAPKTVTVGSSPVYRASVQNAKPGVEFDGTTEYLSVADMPISSVTVFAVFKATGTAGMIYEHSPNGNAAPTVWLYGDTGDTIFYDRAATTGSGKNYTSNWSTGGTVRLLTQEIDGTHASHVLRVNGSNVTLTDGAQTGDPGTQSITDTFYVFARGGSSLFVTGHLLELAVYSPALGSTDRNAIETDLKSKYGL